MFDLRNFRADVLKLTQKELADLIDERQDKISRLEKNPESIGLDILIKIADKTGTTLDELVHYEKKVLDALKVSNTWDSVVRLREAINDTITKALEHQIADPKQVVLAKEVMKFTDLSLRKPKIALVGLSDTGKSTLINSLLGADKLPATWTPTTAISIYIKHMEDKPSYIEEDVWFFKHGEENNLGWDSRRLEDESYCSEWLAMKGHIQDLKTYAVRNEDAEKVIGSAVVFIDSPILKVCDIVDLPGYNTGDRDLDNVLTKQVMDYADVMIYMSLANGFMRGNEIEYIKSDLNGLSIIEHSDYNNHALCNIFVVASQAHVVNKGNRENLTKILHEGANRLYSQIPQEVWQHRFEMTGISYTEEALQGRFFTYSKDIEDLRNAFEIQLIQLIEGYPMLLVQQYKEAMKELCKINKMKIQQSIERNVEIIDKREDYLKLTQNLTNDLAARKLATESLGQSVVDQIQALAELSRGDFFNEMQALISIESIIRLIDEEGYTNTKGNMEMLGSLLNSKVEEKFRGVLSSYSMSLIGGIESYLDGFDALVNDTVNEHYPKLNYTYNSRVAFVKGLSQEPSIGANAAWTTSLGDLGAYSILGKGINVLSAILYSVPGAPDMTYSTAGGAAVGAAMNGTAIGLGIGLALLAITSAMNVFGEGWKKRVAKKIVAAYDDNKIYKTYDKAMQAYWMDTVNAFIHSTVYLENNLDEEISELKEQVNKADEEELVTSNKLSVEPVGLYDEIEAVLSNN